MFGVSWLRRLVWTTGSWLLERYVGLSSLLDKVSLSDLALIFFQVFFTLYASFSMTGVTYGTGRHHKDLELVQIQTAKMVTFPT